VYAPTWSSSSNGRAYA